MLCFLSPITWSVLRLFGLSVTYVVTALVFLARSGGISFCHPFIHYSSINRPLQPSGLIAGYGGTVSQWRVSSIYQFCHITNGVFCHWCEQSMGYCNPDEGNSIKKTLHLGLQKEALSETSMEGEIQTPMVNCGTEWISMCVFADSLVFLFMSRNVTFFQTHIRLKQQSF